MLRVVGLNKHSTRGAIPGCGNFRHHSRGNDVSTKEKEKPKTVQEGTETAVDHRNTRIEGLMEWVPAPSWHQKTILLKEPSVQRCLPQWDSNGSVFRITWELKKKKTKQKNQFPNQNPMQSSGIRLHPPSDILICWVGRKKFEHWHNIKIPSCRWLAVLARFVCFVLCSI